MLLIDINIFIVLISVYTCCHYIVSGLNIGLFVYYNFKISLSIPLLPDTKPLPSIQLPISVKESLSFKLLDDFADVYAIIKRTQYILKCLPLGRASDCRNHPKVVRVVLGAVL